MHTRKKQKQLQRFNNHVKNYRGTMDKKDKEDSLKQAKADIYALTPEDFKYENKHYKYIKYGKHNKVSIEFFTKSFNYYLSISISARLILYIAHRNNYNIFAGYCQLHLC